jgi:nucleobase:cation symporter-1, NCS1 family
VTTGHDRATGGGSAPHPVLTTVAKDVALPIEWRGILPVPPESRHGRARDLITFWFALQLFPVAFFLGAVGAEAFIGLSFWENVLVVVVVNTVAAAIVGTVSIMGPRTGAGQLPLARAAFGRGVLLPGLLASATNIVFLALGAVYGAQALQVVIGWLPFVAALVAVFAAEALICVVGYELLHRYERLTAVLSGLGFLAVGAAILTKTGRISVPQTVHGDAVIGSCLLMGAILFGFSFGWVVMASDFCRYLPRETSARRLRGSVILGLGAGCIVIEVMGLAAASLLNPHVSEMRSLFEFLGGGVLGYAVMVAVGIGVIANITATNYSIGLELAATGLRLRRPPLTAASAALALLLTVWLHNGNLLTKAENLVLIATYWTAPFCAIIAVHWWRNSASRHIAAVEAPVSHLPSGWRAVVALVLGFVASLPFSNTTEGATLAANGGVLKILFGSVSGHMSGGDLAYPVGVLVAGLAYGLLTARRRPRPVYTSSPRREIGH